MKRKSRNTKSRNLSPSRPAGGRGGATRFRSGLWLGGLAGLAVFVLIAAVIAQTYLSEQPAVANEAAKATAAGTANHGSSATKIQHVAERTSPGRPRPTNPLDGARAYRYLQAICALGPRPSGSTGMQKQRDLVSAHFEKLGGKVSLQRFQAPNPLGGDHVPMANVLVEWHPEQDERILLCAHYDTRPLPDQDPDPVQRRTGVFIGANDGASGVAVLMELAHLMRDLESNVGVDFLLVDGEELVYADGDPYFLGSTWFAQQYVRQRPPYRYRWGVVLDMVGHQDLRIYQEQQSATWRDTRPLVREIWATAGRLGIDEFIPRVMYRVMDDHLPLRNIGKIPTCDIIGFVDVFGQSPPGYWHTTMDTPQRCSPASLAKVGWVVYEWLKTQ